MPQYSAEDFRDFRIPPGMGKKIVAIGVVLGVLVLATGSTGIVGAGQRGVLLRFGAVTGEIKEEGLYFKVPFAEQVVLMSTQIQKYSAPASASSKDLQVVTTEVTLNYQLQAAKVGEIYRNMRQDYENRIIQPFIQEALDRFPDYFDPELSIRCGPWLLTDVVRRHPEVTVFPKMYFHPFGWEEKPGRPEDYPEAYAIHYWSKMWLPQSKEKIPR